MVPDLPVEGLQEEAVAVAGADSNHPIIFNLIISKR